MRRRRFVLLSVLVWPLCRCCWRPAAPARAELVYFATGRTLSVKAHRVDGDSLVLDAARRRGNRLRRVDDRRAFAPDEVPYPEPEAEPPAAVAGAADAAAVPYGEHHRQVSAEQGVAAKLVRAVIQVESAYRNAARSPKGAMGLMQLMPRHGAAVRRQPIRTIRRRTSKAGIKHLKSLLQRLPRRAGAGRLQRRRSGGAAVQRHSAVSRDAELRLAASSASLGR